MMTIAHFLILLILVLLTTISGYEGLKAPAKHRNTTEHFRLKCTFQNLAIFCPVEVDNEINLLVKFHAERSYF